MDDGIVPDKVDVHRLFHTDQTIDLLRFAHETVQQGKPCALVMLTEIIGGSSRAAGAMMAVNAAGGYCGMVSGGCVEGVVAREAVQALAEQQDRILRLGKGSSYFDVVLPCGGGIVLAIHVLRDAQALEAVLGYHARRQAVALLYHPQHQTLTCSEISRNTGWHEGQFAVALPPALRLVLLGQGLESEVLYQAATALNIEAMRDALPADTDEATAVVFLQHDLDKELPLLKQALNSRAFYIGCLGSKRTHAVRLEQLLKDGFSQEQIARLSAPIGLFGPVRDARSLAVSVLAEIMARKTEQAKDVRHG
ncbi:XdhC family protein [Pseudochrobactrum sp. Wa41.01b-1]|uniref:XdhC family protein n=1 Tax=Pseudochrobactrum sp. Wa41.01b-1 TaxID=2864102 RepID=UPI001C687C80|nr:XdhC family protein [Pseudochrobactrum sp. Wa41.01b-1]QYM74149.1 XdhC family protein [Pseudochrobactrum sp. Wa41.01b-1]